VTCDRGWVRKADDEAKDGPRLTRLDDTYFPSLSSPPKGADKDGALGPAGGAGELGRTGRICSDGSGSGSAADSEMKPEVAGIDKDEVSALSLHPPSEPAAPPTGPEPAAPPMGPEPAAPPMGPEPAGEHGTRSGAAAARIVDMSASAKALLPDASSPVEIVVPELA
jgi:hypothetical protein